MSKRKYGDTQESENVKEKEVPGKCRTHRIKSINDKTMTDSTHIRNFVVTAERNPQGDHITKQDTKHAKKAPRWRDPQSTNKNYHFRMAVELHLSVFPFSVRGLMWIWWYQFLSSLIYF